MRPAVCFIELEPSLRAKRSNPESGNRLDCHVAYAPRKDLGDDNIKSFDCNLVLELPRMVAARIHVSAVKAPPKYSPFLIPIIVAQIIPPSFI